MPAGAALQIMVEQNIIFFASTFWFRFFVAKICSIWKVLQSDKWVHLQAYSDAQVLQEKLGNHRYWIFMDKVPWQSISGQCTLYCQKPLISHIWDCYPAKPLKHDTKWDEKLIVVQFLLKSSTKSVRLKLQSCTSPADVKKCARILVHKCKIIELHYTPEDKEFISR